MSSGSTNLSSALSVSGSFTSNPVVVNVEKDKDSLWYFTAEQLANSPSRRHGIDTDQELSYRQMTAYLIQEMGQRLQVSQLCINTAIVYMHRFYAFHSFTHFHRNGIAAASLFLAAKVEEQPRKLEHVIKAANKCLNQPTSSTTDAYYLEQAQDLVFNENVLLQTLGFDVAIDHPHTHVVKTCHLVKACKDLAQTSYFLASNSLHLTSMCLQYKPTVVACFCIYLACKWSRWEIPQSTEGKHWFHYVDKTVTMDLLKQLTDEFIAIYEKSPARLKSKLNSIKALAQGASNRVVNKDKKAKPEEWKMVDMMKMYHSSINTNEPNNVITSSNTLSISLTSDQHQQSGQAPLLPPPHSHQQIRRPESHSSQHRAHHSSSTSHHHSKQAFATNDVPDQKSTTSHKQQHSSSANRPRDHSQYSQNINAISIIPSSTSASRSSVSSGNNSSSRPVMPSGVLSQKLSSQQPHDTSYHKSRDRNCLPASTNPSAALLPSHKLTQKPELSRMVSKEHMGRMSEQNKPTNNKIFVPANVSSQSGNSQLHGGVDISRNVIQQHQRQPSSGYHQSTIPRTSNNKQEQSMPVQVQQSQHKHPLSLESQFSSTSSEFLPTQSLISTSATTHSNSRTTDAPQNGDEINNETSQIYSSLNPFQGFKPQTQQQTKLSMFSPELSEPMQHQQLGATNNSKKIERERSLGTPTKKERNRISYAGIEISNQSAAASRSSSQSMQKLQIQKKLDTGNVSNVLAGTSATAYSSIKRHNDNAPILQDEDLNRDPKMRKLESSSANPIVSNYAEVRTANDSNKLQIVNGIETNPDMVRNLLKEGLCTTNALIKTELPPPPNFHPPTQLLEPANMQLIDEKAISSIQAPMEIDETAGGKSEKKKKKDKHKHKEKDKSKDREERRKHKKEKDRHKERDSEISEPVKIKISKEKLETSSNTAKPLGFKIQISKDRIIGDLSSSGNNFGNTATDSSKSANISSPPALKIKISKDKLENYSSGSSDSATTSFNTSHNQTLLNNNPHSSVVSNNSNSRKKDRERDRDRDKEKKRSNLEHIKSNANGSGVPVVGGNQYAQSSSCSKSSSSSKLQMLRGRLLKYFPSR